MARPLLPPGGSLNSSRATKSPYSVLGVDGAALVRLADDGAVLDLVLSIGPAQPSKSLPLKTSSKPLWSLTSRSSSLASLGGDLADEDVAPADLAAVGLQLDRPFPQQRQLAVPVVLQPGVVDDELVVEIHGDPLAELEDAEAVPFAERLVGQDERIFAGSAGAVVPQAAAALVGAEVPLAAFLGVVPDLHLRRGPQIDAAVALGEHLVVDQQLDVAVVLVGGQVGALAVVDDLAVLDLPVLLDVLVPFVDLGLALAPRTWPPACTDRSVGIPCQPVRSLPLNRAVKPFGASPPVRGLSIGQLVCRRPVPPRRGGSGERRRCVVCGEEIVDIGKSCGGREGVAFGGAAARCSREAISFSSEPPTIIFVEDGLRQYFARRALSARRPSISPS